MGRTYIKDYYIIWKAVNFAVIVLYAAPRWFAGYVRPNGGEDYDDLMVMISQGSLFCTDLRKLVRKLSIVKAAITVLKLPINCYLTGGFLIAEDVLTNVHKSICGAHQLIWKYRFFSCFFLTIFCCFAWAFLAVFLLACIISFGNPFAVEYCTEMKLRVLWEKSVVIFGLNEWFYGYGVLLLSGCIPVVFCKWQF